MFTGLNMNQRQANAEEQICHKLVSLARFTAHHRLDQLDPNRRLERIGLTEQKVHVLAKKFIEEMDVLIRAHDIKNVVQRHLWADQIMASHHSLQNAEQR